MKTRSILSAAIGSVFFASAIMMLIPTMASATFQDAGSPPRVSQAVPSHASQAIRPVGKHLSAQQMKATQGALGMICSGDCNSGIDGCGPSSAYGGSYCTSYYYHHLVCVADNNWGGVYSTCNNNISLDCYDYVYYVSGCEQNTLGRGAYLGTATHPQWCCGS